MEYIENEKGIVLKKPNSFLISQTLECGQCFNFNKLGEEDYIVTAHGKALHVFKENHDFVFEGATATDFETIWKHYFDFNRDYESIKSDLGSNDPILKAALDHAPGIRIINQEFFQCLISFIISQNNRIPMIKKVVKNLSQRYGEYLCTVGGEDYFSFPCAKKLYGVGADELMECKTGFRGKYIADAVTKFVDGNLEEDTFSQMTTAQLRAKLMTINGVGPKVADCVMLFSLGRSDAFPTDVWVQRIMSDFYFDKKDTPVKEIHAFANQAFGNYAGFAQQYLFNYAREFKVGTGKEG